MLILHFENSNFWHHHELVWSNEPVDISALLLALRHLDWPAVGIWNRLRLEPYINRCSIIRVCGSDPVSSGSSFSQRNLVTVISVRLQLSELLYLLLGK